MNSDNLTNVLSQVYDPVTIVLNLAIACGLGMVISSVYKTTHRGLSYSQSFMLTIVFVTVVVAMVMMVIGNNLARAFALVGALSIIRFRTVIKDTKDTVYIFLSLAGGMAAGTSSYFLGFAGVGIISAFAMLLHYTNYGSIFKSEIIVRFRARAGLADQYDEVFTTHARSVNLLHLEPSGDEHTSNLLTFDVILNRDASVERLAEEMNAIDGINELRIIASKTDVDY
jgi:hypothetical protein